MSNLRIDPIAERDANALAHAESDTFRARVLATIVRITVALRNCTRPYVAFSGGKDSMVVLHLVESITGGITVAWSDDEMEFPETVALMSAMHGDPSFVITEGYALHGGWFWPWRDRPFWRDPLPGTIRIQMAQDDWMRQRGHDLTFLGTRSEESYKRRDWLTFAHMRPEANGAWYPVADGTGKRSCPIWDWSVTDVWAYTISRNLPVNPAYHRLAAAGVPLQRQRVGPLPLARRADLADGWPDVLANLEARYGNRWS